MKKIVISIGWILIVAGSVSLLLFSRSAHWNSLSIFIVILLGFSFVAGIVTLIRTEKIAFIPLLLGGFSFCCLCAVLEIKHFFLISLLYFIALMIYFISYGFTINKS